MDVPSRHCLFLAFLCLILDLLNGYVAEDKVTKFQILPFRDSNAKKKPSR